MSLSGWLVACLLTLGAPLAAHPVDSGDPSLVFEKHEAMVAMRDGIRLQTEVYFPRGTTEKLPVLLMRTPYGFSPDAKGYSMWLVHPWLRDLLRDGYIVALQSVRGRFRSEGRYLIEPERRDPRDPGSTDEGTDTYDTVDWLLARFATNGRVGMLGVSNPGRLVAMAMFEPHPAIRAYSPQATPADNFIGDDFFHGGAFRLPMIEFIYALEPAPEFTDFPFDRADLYDWYLAMGPLSRVNPGWMRDQRPTWNLLVAHPTYDDYWKRHALPPQLDRPVAPTLHVGGAFDQEDRRGPVALYTAMERNDRRGWNSLVVGPWAHRTWRLEEGERLGPLDFGSPTARYFREEVQAPFFACHLKDRCGPPLPEALVFQTGTNVWKRYAAWPPREARPRSLWLREGGRLAFEPAGRESRTGADDFVSDPARPVPSQPRPIVAPNVDKDQAEAGWATSLVVDQRFVAGRPDVLLYQTEPLQEDVEVAGQITARLFVSTTGADADFVAKLIDAWPEQVPGKPTMGGYQLMVAGEILRGRFRQGYERAVPFTPGRVEELSIDLLTRSHVFRKGHRIMLQVHSTWFPLYDRNPQTWVPNIFAARAEDFRAQTHQVHRTGRHPSRITFDGVDPRP